MSFFLELRRRNVVRVGVAYLAAAWLLLQVASVVLSSFESPGWIMQALIFASALGFPFTLLLAWYYELTPEGVKAASELDVVEPTRFLGRGLDFAIIAVLVLALSFVTVQNYFLDEPVDPEVDVPDEHSIAVLRFENLSGDEDNRYFSDGMAEEILNLLTRIPGLRTVGRTSSFAFDGVNDLPSVIGDALGVSTLLEGSVRMQGDMVRINAKLIDAADGTIIWQQTYNHTMTDIFAVQDQVAAAIIDELQILVGDSPTRGRPTESPAAYALFLRSRDFLNRFQLREAETAALGAIDLDPDYAEAFELLASVYWAQAGGILEPSAAQGLVGETAARALTINPSLVLANALERSGNLATYTPLAEIEVFVEAALEEPDNPLILATLVFNLRKAGYLEEALVVADRLVALDPFSEMARGRWRSTLFATGRSCEAFEYTEALDELADLGLQWDNWFTAEVNLVLGRDDIAIANLESFFSERSYADPSWASDLVIGARDPVTGQGYLDERIPQIVAAAPGEDQKQLERNLWGLYLVSGFLDAYYDRIVELDLSGSTWSNADDLIDKGIIFPELGFTSHPEYLGVAERLGLVDVWEERGPPDFCRQETGGWVCESVAATPLDACE